MEKLNNLHKKKGLDYAIFEARGEYIPIIDYTKGPLYIITSNGKQPVLGPEDGLVYIIGSHGEKIPILGRGDYRPVDY